MKTKVKKTRSIKVSASPGEGQGMTKSVEEKIKISCDQVAWINAILDRLLESVIPRYLSISRYRKVVKISVILELMEILHLEFADKDAAGNALAGLPEFNILRDFPSSDGCLAGGPLVNGDLMPSTKEMKRYQLRKKSDERKRRKKGSKV